MVGWRIPGIVSVTIVIQLFRVTGHSPGFAVEISGPGLR